MGTENIWCWFFSVAVGIAHNRYKHIIKPQIIFYIHFVTLKLMAVCFVMDETVMVFKLQPHQKLTNTLLTSKTKT